MLEPLQFSFRLIKQPPSRFLGPSVDFGSRFQSLVDLTRPSRQPLSKGKWSGRRRCEPVFEDAGSSDVCLCVNKSVAGFKTILSLCIVLAEGKREFLKVDLWPPPHHPNEDALNSSQFCVGRAAPWPYALHMRSHTQKPTYVFHHLFHTCSF